MIPGGAGPLIIMESSPDDHAASGPTSSADVLRGLTGESRRACDLGMHQLALRGVLCLIDTCGAIGSQNGRSTEGKFRRWLEQFAGYDDDLTSRLWGLRCSVLHQGRALPDRHEIPIAFIEPGPDRGRIHCIETEVEGAVILWLDLNSLIDEVGRAVDLWLDRRGAQQPVLGNLTHVARVRPEGLPPHLVGLPVLA